jgi:hypothetical protein
MRHLLKVLLILVTLSVLGMLGLYVLTAHSEMRHERGAVEAAEALLWGHKTAFRKSGRLGPVAGLQIDQACSQPMNAQSGVDSDATATLTPTLGG